MHHSKIKSSPVGYLSQSHPTGTNATTQCTQVDSKQALLDLGILHLETWHKRTLEAQLSLADTPVGYYERLTLALK